MDGHEMDEMRCTWDGQTSMDEEVSHSVGCQTAVSDMQGGNGSGVVLVFFGAALGLAGDFLTIRVTHSVHAMQFVRCKVVFQYKKKVECTQ